MDSEYDHRSYRTIQWKFGFILLQHDDKQVPEIETRTKITRTAPAARFT